MNCFQLCTFFIGFVIGMYLFTVFFNNNDDLLVFPVSQLVPTDQKRYQTWAQRQGLDIKPISLDRLTFSQEDHSNELESKALYNLIQLTCVVFVKKDDYAYAISSTWGQKCNELFFYANKEVPFLEVNVYKGGRDTWALLCDTIRTVHSNDWVVFSDDDVFVIPENLRYILVDLDPDEPHYIGHNEMFWGTVYNTAKTAYVLSRGAMRSLVNKFNSTSACQKSSKYKNNQDYLLGKYLSELGIQVSDGRDDYERHRFHFFSPNQLLGEKDYDIKKLTTKSLYPVTQGENCCSSTSISFKTSSEQKMYQWLYFIYKVQLFNIMNGLGNNKTKTSVTTDEVWKDFVLEKLGPNYNISLITDERYYELTYLLRETEDYNALVKDVNGQFEMIKPRS